mmetsp:Transcript_11491/g.22658  ORF Transcript_11491/g.22658 Transcript_11491/m.22658 type:complete len:243 (-) Transcript_11491:170-898(-)
MCISEQSLNDGPHSREVFVHCRQHTPILILHGELPREEGSVDARKLRLVDEERVFAAPQMPRPHDLSHCLVFHSLHGEVARQPEEGAVDPADDVAGRVEDGCLERPVRPRQIADHRLRDSVGLLSHVAYDGSVPVEQGVVVGLLEADDEVGHLEAPLHREVGLGEELLQLCLGLCLCKCLMTLENGRCCCCGSGRWRRGARRHGGRGAGRSLGWSFGRRDLVPVDHSSAGGCSPPLSHPLVL